MASRAETEVLNFRARLEKSLGVDDSSLEEFIDVLSALKSVPITIDILRKTKIGQTLQDVKKKHAANDVGAQTKALLSKWKKDCEPPATEGSSSSVTKPKSEPVTPREGVEKKAATSPSKGWGTLVSKDTSKINNEEEEVMDEGMYDLLSAQRKQVMNFFVTTFKVQINEEVAKFLSFNVEASIYQLHNAERDYKAYLAKAKTLAFNLKKNERLRTDIVEGRMPPDQVVHLSTSELATAEVRGEREKSAEAAMLARRGDLYEITRAQILKSNGIDPNKGGEFCCRRCKGTKTTHYALQTRSSDEPMTVFVCCLTCGNRWRCT